MTKDIFYNRIGQIQKIKSAVVLYFKWYAIYVLFCIPAVFEVIMIDKLIELIEKSANDHVDGMCSAVSAHFCRSTDCSECVFDDQKVGVLLSELKELQEMKRHAELIKKVYEGKISGMVVEEDYDKESA